MTTEHPITPPPELVKQLCDKAILHAVDGAKRGEVDVWLIQEAFRAGADQELDACCEWGKSKQTYWAHDELRAARRPKQLSLKKQAMQVLLECGYTLDGRMELEAEDIDIIHRALEQIND